VQLLRHRQERPDITQFHNDHLYVPSTEFRRSK
jgi:hypothetical protein